MAARAGAAWRGGHVLGSSARASLSDLYGSSRRTGAAERETARVRALSRRRHASRRTARFQFFGVFVLFSPPAKVDRITLKGPGECVAGDFRAVPSFLIAAPEPVSSSSGSAPGVPPCEEPTRRRMSGTRRRGGPAAAQPPPRARGGEGRGRRTPDTWRELGGDGPELLAAEARERCTLPFGDCADPAGVCCAFAPHFLLLRGTGRALLGAGEGASASAKTSPHLFSFQRGRLRRERPARPARGAGAAYDPPGSRGAPGAAERRGAGRGLRAGAGRPGRAEAPGGFRRRRKDGGASEPPHSPSAWSGASPTPWPWLR
ncbi:PREDICTED: uncharacterized protein LOC109389329 [Hipposideros armiger]|uniref:Uncharacterized protein LOC109389329 n=1 Tax=Hipposideros armiger TaxID=186990 RepID=A0A8B7SBV4_HIPAR|nr:PREDICTED: uncharacterized protein LOC109389329 [Hipposideros armiger]